MAHEITTTDGLLLVKDSAWHGLGTIIPESVIPTKALGLIGADWGVRQMKLKAYDEVTGEEVLISDKLVNLRADNCDPLGIVSTDYQIFTNRQVAEFCEALAETGEGDSSVRVETAGTIRGGKKVWFLLRGAEFQVANNDSIFPYVLVSNGHDGVTGLRVTPTTIRVVCSNTLHAVIPDGRSYGRSGSAAITIEHMGDLQSKVEEAKNALLGYRAAIDETKTYMDHLAAKSTTTDQLAAYFAANYNRDYSPVDVEDTGKKQARRKEMADRGFRLFMNRFEAEEDIAGATWWNALNAYTGYVQHDRKRKGGNLENNLFGSNSHRSVKAFELAVASVL